MLAFTFTSMFDDKSDTDFTFNGSLDSPYKRPPRSRSSSRRKTKTLNRSSTDPRGTAWNSTVELISSVQTRDKLVNMAQINRLIRSMQRMKLLLKCAQVTTARVVFVLFCGNFGGQLKYQKIWKAVFQFALFCSERGCIFNSRKTNS